MVRQLPEVRSPEDPSGSRVLDVEEGSGRDYYLLAVCLIGILAVWIRPLASSLWLDETGTFMVIRGSLNDVIHQGLEFQGQFPLYHVFLWSWSKLAGTSEIALRLPSLFGALLAAWLCYRLALRLFADVNIARLAGYIFVLLPPVAFAAADARPYALALAALLGATLVLFRWMESERLRDGILYVGLVALTLYLDYMFALALIPHALIAYRHVRQKGRRGAVAVAGATGAIVLLMLPTVPHFIDVIGRRDAYSLHTFGTVADLLAWWIPPILVASYLVGSYLHLPDDPSAPKTDRLPRDLLQFLCLWLFLPPLMLYRGRARERYRHVRRALFPANGACVGAARSLGLCAALDQAATDRPRRPGDTLRPQRLGSFPRGFGLAGRRSGGQRPLRRPADTCLRVLGFL